MTSIVTAIRSALAAAGLGERHGALRRVIDAALARAGLHGPDARPAGAPPCVPTPLEEVNGIHVPVGRPTRDATAAGTFTAHTHRGPRGALDYWLYVPAAARGRALPLIVMLHGCRQNPEDFAAGTRMNELAERHGFLVAYPEQPSRANGSSCWNWFMPGEQRRDGREPSLLAGIAGDVAGHQPIDGRRVFAAGRSAGGAMAVILGRLYPEVFGGVAAHSGLPMGAAHDVPSAFAAMRGQARPGPLAADAVPSSRCRTLVLHGDADPTVAVSNADAIVAQAVAGFASGGQPLRSLSARDEVANGRRMRRVDHVDASGVVMVRDLRVQGSGHAWAGGSSAGSPMPPGPMRLPR